MRVYGSELLEGGIYKFCFHYDGGKLGTALIRWASSGKFPWLPLHNDDTFFMNRPAIDYGTYFELASFTEIIWLKACIVADKYLSKEHALALDGRKVGDRVKLNDFGLSEWGSQAPEGVSGIITSISFTPGDWGTSVNLVTAKLTIYVCWDNDHSNSYPEIALREGDSIIKTKDKTGFLDMECMFEKGDKVELSFEGLKKWSHQAPDKHTGIVTNIERKSKLWKPPFNYSKKIAIQVKWDNGYSDIYPEDGLELKAESVVKEVPSTAVDWEIDMSFLKDFKEEKYFQKESDMTLEELIDNVE